MANVLHAMEATKKLLPLKAAAF